MNQPHDVAKYGRIWESGADTPLYYLNDLTTTLDRVFLQLFTHKRIKGLVFVLHNGQRVIVRPLSPERLRQREDERKARDRFIPTVNLDGTTNHETATRIARAFCNGEPQRMAPTACTHLGARGYGE